MPDTVNSRKYPSAKEVTDIHRNSDVDHRAESQHHTLGKSRTQASPGDHTHDGGTSQPLLTDFITGNIGTLQGHKDAIKQIMAALADIGLGDSTSNSGNWNDARIGSTNATWTSAGTTSDTIVVTFSPAMGAAPRISLTPRTSATVVIVPYVIAAGTITGFSFRLVAATSQTAGTSIPVEWIAIAPVAFT